MAYSNKTKRFIENYVLPLNKALSLEKTNANQLINFITEEFEQPMSMKLANGETIDLDLFSEVNLVLNELSLNK